ncbi:MAG: hypothetical protein SOW06_08210 [Succinivibrionaceae bacterium]|jgi:curli biogenesis system outer membrane secretion channel CsgG|nr:hypothetical protein [Succinivibrionaceae bacterium]MCI6199498.1 hypothetical protein [Pseudomonadota bacterium]MDY3145336.1 hypothetical protein [Succinivibrionaceae bacterium]MDY6273797.1 hypothetical protein [Succinivibrionaceae bacterium]MDY6337445.1 hypothetical protein [Succinivibrionaceae bacterium]
MINFPCRPSAAAADYNYTGHSKMKVFQTIAAAAIAAAFAAGCSSESWTAIAEQPVQAERLQTVRGRLPVRISGVTNDLRANGLFGKTTDTISSETDGILRKRISGNRSFILHQKADRSSGKVYAISANISRFGRRSDNEGAGLPAVYQNSMEQTAYASITLKIVDPETNKIVRSASGKSEYFISSPELMRAGSSPEADQAIDIRVIDMALTDALSRLSDSLDIGSGRL